jgi:hypothetical protein
MKKEKILKAYFDNSSRRVNGAERTNTIIIDLLNKYGCNVIQTTMGTDITYSENVGDKASVNIFLAKRNDNRVADVLVYEVSDMSVVNWYMIFEAIQNRKPVLALFRSNTLSKTEIQFLETVSEYIYPREYTEEDLDAIVREFIGSSKRKIPSSRFTVRLSEDLDELVEQLKNEYDCSSKNDTIIRILEEKKDNGYSRSS